MKEFLIVLAICFVGLCSWFVGAGVCATFDGHEARYFQGGYRQGQIDAINGIIKYELLEQSDHTKVWVEKGEKK